MVSDLFCFAWAFCSLVLFSVLSTYCVYIECRFVLSHTVGLRVLFLELMAPFQFLFPVKISGEYGCQYVNYSQCELHLWHLMVMLPSSPVCNTRTSFSIPSCNFSCFVSCVSGHWVRLGCIIVGLGLVWAWCITADVVSVPVPTPAKHTYDHEAGDTLCFLVWESSSILKYLCHSSLTNIKPLVSVKIVAEINSNIARKI